MRDLAFNLGRALRDLVAPRLGSVEGRAHSRVGHSGDVTFAIDAAAESFLEHWVFSNAPGVAFFSEDRGLVSPTGETAQWVLVVDPIDGTRPALAGLESACTSVAVAPLGDGSPRMGDVVAGCVVEIKSGDWFLASRGAGLESSRPIAPSQNTDLSKLFWVMGFCRRPARPLVEVLGDLIDMSSRGGGVFDLGSACFDMTRVLTGQLDAYVEPGPRLVEEVPGMREEFERVGSGHINNNTPYDLAAAALCLTEGGVVLTDARGESLDSRPLLGSSPDFQMSVCAAANARLHTLLLGEVERGMTRLRDTVRAD